MVGRAAELDRLTRLLADPGAATDCHVALVAGEAGVGKTRLVRELVGRVPSGATVLAGQADPGALGRPFEHLLDALDGHDTDPGVIEAVTDRRQPIEDRIAGGVGLVRQIAGERPALLVFEDLHWADSESLSLFERLAEPDFGPLVLVGTYRPDAISRRHPVAELLPRLERRHTVTHVRLGRLSPLDVGAFLTAVYGRSPSFRVVEALHTRTGGNPFFLEELLGNATEDLDHLADQPLPWSLAEVVRSQLDELEPVERRILEAAAVLGRRVAFDLLAVVTRTTEDELIDVLRDLVGRGLLIEDEHDVFLFRHALARETIETELLGRERRRLHRAALDALCESGECDLADIAQHAAGAGDDERLVRAARDGAQEYLDAGSPYQALQLAELGLAVIEDDPKLLACAARAAWLTGLLADARAHSHQRLEVARRSGEPEAESAALRLDVRLAWEVGDTDDLVRSTATLVALVERLEPSEERGRAMAVVAQSFMLRDLIPDSIAWADRALAEADALEGHAADAVRANALVEKGSALVMDSGRFDEGAALLEAAAEIGERSGGEDVVVARALHNLARTDTRPRDAAAARRQLDRMRAAAERVGFDSMAGSAHAQGLADLAQWEGDLGAALEALAEGRRIDRGYLLTNRGGWFSVHEAGLLLEAGEPEGAHEVVEALANMPAKKPYWYNGLAAHVASRIGDAASAREHLASLIALARSAAVGSGGHMLGASMVHDIVSAALAAGLDVSELQPLYDLLPDQVVAGPGSDADGEPCAGRALVAAQLLEAAGDVDGALPAYERAAVAERALYPSERGTAHVGAARCLIAAGRLDEAKAHVIEAERLLARWGGWRVAELEVVRRRLGRGGPVDGPAALTPREREVVGLLAEGLTNAELAGRLYISPKTAAVHVSNVLAKLGMASRTEVAAWAIREGLAG
jgi:DNA-binding CsgD family transcriptional regulator/tetratricopeptide (TPR) repeat protein